MEKLIDYLTTILPLEHFVLFAGVEFFLLVVILAAVLVDFGDGLHTAKVLGEHIRSHKLRITIVKIMEYWAVAFLAFLVDCVGALHPIYSLPYISMGITAGILLIEGKSLIEHGRRRKSRTAKLPGALRDLVDIFGETDVKDFVLEIAKRKIASQTDNS